MKSSRRRSNPFFAVSHHSWRSFCSFSSPLPAGAESSAGAGVRLVVLRLVLARLFALQDEKDRMAALLGRQFGRSRPILWPVRTDLQDVALQAVNHRHDLARFSFRAGEFGHVERFRLAGRVQLVGARTPLVALRLHRDLVVREDPLHRPDLLEDVVVRRLLAVHLYRGHAPDALNGVLVFLGLRPPSTGPRAPAYPRWPPSSARLRAPPPTNGRPGRRRRRTRRRPATTAAANVSFVKNMVRNTPWETRSPAPMPLRPSRPRRPRTARRPAPSHPASAADADAACAATAVPSRRRTPPCPAASAAPATAPAPASVGS